MLNDIHPTPLKTKNPFIIYGNRGARALRPGSSARAVTAPALSRTEPAVKSVTPKTFDVGLPGLNRFAPKSRWKVRCRTWAGYLLLGFVLFSILVPLPAQQRIYHFQWPNSPFTHLDPKASSSTSILNGYVTSHFGPRWGRPHQGVDVAALPGTPIYAAASGEVIYSGWETGYGKSVLIDHGNNLKTRYAHCSRLNVSVGKRVYKGDEIASVGSTGHSTGPHLHFEVLIKNVRKNPLWYFSIGNSVRKPQNTHSSQVITHAQ